MISVCSGWPRKLQLPTAYCRFELENRLRLKLAAGTRRELAKPNIEQEIQQAVESKLNVSCKLEMIAEAQLETETPHQARIRVLEEQRQAAIGVIQESETVKKLKQGVWRRAG